MFYKLAVLLSRILMFRHKTVWAAPLPKGPAIIAPNHSSYLDPMLVSVSMPEKVVFFARDSLFHGIMGVILRSANTYPIKRGEGDIRAIKQILKFLKEGKKVVLFPEGTRSDTGELGTLQSGVAILAKRAKVPIVPIKIEGTFEAYPRGKRFPNPLKKTRCIVLKSLYPENYSSPEELLEDLKKSLT